MKYYIIAGEASGDLHGSNLIKELKKLDDDAVIRCWGGDMMEQQGTQLVKHYRNLAFMGFVEVIKNLKTILNNLKFCKEDILQFKPDAIILIDYPGFNLRIAEWAKEQRIKVIYYISPQVWAWKENRVKKMKECINKMLVILPFEKDYYKEKWNWEVEYVGHPLVEAVNSWSRIESGTVDSKKQTTDNRPQTTENSNQASVIRHPSSVIALLPGSRKQEILKKLPIMLEVSKSFPDYNFIVAKAPGVEESFYDELLKPFPNVSYVSGKTYDLLLQARAALVTSGTATLETALFGVPEVVCYKGNPVSYQIAKRLIKIKYISLVNLIMDKEVVKELIQNELTSSNLQKELNELLYNPERIAALKEDYRQLKHKLSQGGNASAKAARSIYKFLISS